MKVGYLVDSGFMMFKDEFKSEISSRVEFIEFTVINPLNEEISMKTVTLTREVLEQQFDKFPNAPLKTSLSSAEMIRQKLKQMLLKFDVVIGLPIAKSLSGQYNSFKNLENEFKGRFIVSGKQNIGTNTYELLKQIDEATKKVKSISDLKSPEFWQKVEKSIITKGLLYVTNITRLALSGRIPKYKTVIGKLMKLKLCFSLAPEELLLAKKGKSLYQLVNRSLQDTLKDLKKEMKNGKINASIYYFGVEKSIIENVSNILKEYVETIKEIDLIPAIYCVHLGKGTLAILISKTLTNEET